MARPTNRRPGNVPAEATSLIGRRRQVAEIRKPLTSARLVSLIGPGGVGKNMNVARSLVASLRHDLIAERPLLVAELGLRRLGLRESVRAALAQRRIGSQPRIV